MFLELLVIVSLLWLLLSHLLTNLCVKYYTFDLLKISEVMAWEIFCIKMFQRSFLTPGIAANRESHQRGGNETCCQGDYFSQFNLDWDWLKSKKESKYMMVCSIINIWMSALIRIISAHSKTQQWNVHNYWIYCTLWRIKSVIWTGAHKIKPLIFLIQWNKTLLFLVICTFMIILYVWFYAVWFQPW